MWEPIDRSRSGPTYQCSSCVPLGICAPHLSNSCWIISCSYHLAPPFGFVISRDQQTRRHHPSRSNWPWCLFNKERAPPVGGSTGSRHCQLLQEFSAAEPPCPAIPLLGVVTEHLLTYQSASPRNPEDSCGVSYVHRHSLENLLYAKLRVYFLWEPNLWWVAFKVLSFYSLNELIQRRVWDYY